MLSSVLSWNAPDDGIKCEGLDTHYIHMEKIKSIIERGVSYNFFVGILVEAIGCFYRVPRPKKVFDHSER